MKYIIFLLFILHGFLGYTQEATEVILQVRIDHDTISIVPEFRNGMGRLTSTKPRLSGVSSKIRIEVTDANQYTYQLSKSTNPDTIISNPTSIALTTSHEYKVDDQLFLIKNDKLVEDLGNVPIQSIVIRIGHNGSSKEIALSEILDFGGKKEKDKGNKVKSACDSCDRKFIEESELPRVYYYDASCKVFYRKTDKGMKVVNLLKEKIPYRSQIQIRVENINRYIYDVNIISRNIDYESEIPPLLKNFFFGDSAKALGRLMSAVPGVQSNKDLDAMTKKFEDLSTILRRFMTNIDSLKVLKLKAYMICDSLKCCGEEEFTVGFGDLLRDLRELKILLIGLKLEKETLKTELGKLEKEKLNCANKPQELKNSIVKRDQLQLKKRKKKLSKIDSDNLDELVKSIAELKLAIPSCKNDDVIRDQNINRLNEILNFISVADTIRLSLPSDDEIARAYLFVMNMRKKNNLVITPPISIIGNLLELAFEIKPNDSSLVKKWEIMPMQTDSFGLEIPILWKPFVSFSAGSYIRLGKSLENKTYDWQVLPSSNNTVTDTSKYILTESGYSAPPMGFSAFANIEWKTSPLFGFGASVGVGITIEEEPRISYLTGGSIFIGDRRQFAITAGIAAMQIDKLKNNLEAVYDQGIIYNAKAPIEYYKEFKIGGFISLSYTPFTYTRSTLNRSGRR